MTTHYWPLPFGAERQEDNAFRFKLWAPAANDVTLVIQSEQQHTVTVPMLEASGWFIVETSIPKYGDQYGFSIDGRDPIPDPASRYQPKGVHSLSELVNSEDWQWRDSAWRGRPWKEVVIYELHIGTFTAEGTYRSAAKQLPYLQSLGITAIELMPVAAFPGVRGWGYDGVLPYAPYACYGTPNDLKHLIDTAHQHGIAVILDVVYNHFGPEGNYMAQYAPDVRSKKYHTEWGEAFNFESPHNGKFTREYFINNALYWLSEYRFDGLRLDATHAMKDSSQKHVLTELAERVYAGPGVDREIWLIQENCMNFSQWYERGPDGAVERYHAQWNDDFHRSIEVLGGGEQNGVYRDFADAPSQWLARALADGYAYQGEISSNMGRPRGTKGHHLPPLAHINFIENHDQVANRPYCARMSERLDPNFVRVSTEVLLLLPQVPLLFMGQEWAAKNPFTFFCDVDSWLAPSVNRGRKKEIANINGITTPLTQQQVPPPDNPLTFTQATLQWGDLEKAEHKAWLALHQQLLKTRAAHLVPLLAETLTGGHAHFLAEKVFFAQWKMRHNQVWTMLLNLSSDTVEHNVTIPDKHVYQSVAMSAAQVGEITPYSVVFYIETDLDERFLDD